MTLTEYLHLQAERSALEKLLKETPPERVIDRIGLEARKQEVVKTLANQPTPSS